VHLRWFLKELSCKLADTARDWNGFQENYFLAKTLFDHMCATEWMIFFKPFIRKSWSISFTFKPFSHNFSCIYIYLFFFQTQRSTYFRTHPMMCVLVFKNDLLLPNERNNFFENVRKCVWVYFFIKKNPLIYDGLMYSRHIRLEAKQKQRVWKNSLRRRVRGSSWNRVWDIKLQGGVSEWWTPVWQLLSLPQWFVAFHKDLVLSFWNLKNQLVVS